MISTTAAPSTASGLILPPFSHREGEAEGRCFSSWDGEGSRRRDCSSTVLTGEVAKGQETEVSMSWKKRNKSGTHRPQSIRTRLPWGFGATHGDGSETGRERGLLRSTVRHGSAVMNAAEIPYWGCWAQTDPGASLGCFAGDPAPGPAARRGRAVKHKQDAHVCCRSPGEESHVSQRPEKPPQEIHTLNLCSLKTGKQPLEHIYCFNLNKQVL
ncbi:uncharacterized protein LOC128154788 [Harpia harpyja]|uniref:uncharacterized protein LOC128154788 n=1 Tax=Harpia harpyja TaxID=202280 RepID=UPI0022B11875|nr:uncharacterized protein LOC128154788 [Harpia harpyja]